MLTKIHDWIGFFEEAIFDLRTGDDWRDKLGGIWASLQDLVFYGGRICNWHGNLLCKKCYSKEFIQKALDESTFAFGEWNSPEADTKAGLS